MDTDNNIITNKKSIPEEETANETEDEDNEARNNNLRHCSSRPDFIFYLRQMSDFLR